MTKLSLHSQGSTWVVVGTDDVQAAAAMLRAKTHIDRWGGSFPGAFAHRRNGLTDVRRDPPGVTPRDARPGVVFTSCRDEAGDAVTARSELRRSLTG